MPLSKQLRDIEKVVDESFRSNRLINQPYTSAMWHLLTACEYKVAVAFKNGPGDANGDVKGWLSALTDNVMNEAKWPIRWITSATPPGGSTPLVARKELLNAGLDLLQLSNVYQDVETMYTYASYTKRCLLELEVDGQNVSAKGIIKSGSKYDAYDRLVIHGEPETPIPSPRFMMKLVNNLVFTSTGFSWPLTSDFLKQCIEDLQPIFTSLTLMPEHWTFPDFSSGDFKKVADCLRAMAFVHAQARALAELNGARELGIHNAVLVIETKKLVALVSTAIAVDPMVTASVIDFLSLGSHNIVDIDPAMQPLVVLTRDHTAISPALLMTSAFERNFMVLANRIKSFKNAYSTFNEEREEISRRHLTDSLRPSRFSFWHGDVTAWGKAGQIDLLLIDNVDRCGLLLEAKSFLAPAEPREIINRSEEIEKGIDQIKARREAYRTGGQQGLAKAASFDVGYDMFFAVVSDNSIGAGYVQDMSVPVINRNHLIRILQQCGSLRRASRILQKRAYLPVEGKNYFELPRVNTIAGWTFHWFGIAPGEPL